MNGTSGKNIIRKVVLKDKKLKDKNMKQKGVTLIEMAAVVGLLLILVSIGTVIWVNQADRAFRNAVVHSTRDIVTIMKIYRTDNGDYPPGPGLGPLMPYTNITTLVKDYQVLSIVKTGSAVCLEGLLNGIQPRYNTILCAETDDAAAVKYKSATMPGCCWEKTTVCSTAANWYPCKDKM